MLERQFRIVNPLGLHARAAAKLVRLVNQRHSTVILRCESREADAASILGILAMAAGNGSLVKVIVDGPDEIATIELIEQLFNDGFGEM